MGISRRAFIAASSAFAGTLAFTGFARAQTKESAFLQAQVDGGTLPPVAEREPSGNSSKSPLLRLLGLESRRLRTEWSDVLRRLPVRHGRSGIQLPDDQLSNPRTCSPSSVPGRTSRARASRLPAGCRGIQSESSASSSSPRTAKRRGRESASS